MGGRVLEVNSGQIFHRDMEISILISIYLTKHKRQNKGESVKKDIDGDWENTSNKKGVPDQCEEGGCGGTNRRKTTAAIAAKGREKAAGAAAGYWNAEEERA